VSNSRCHPIDRWRDTRLAATDSLEDVRSHLARAKKFLKYDNPSEMYLSTD
jgi:hypothetical protein